MPSPFPGMDPYLEGELWTNFHTQFAVEIARQISPLLRPRYAAFTEKRLLPGAIPHVWVEIRDVEKRASVTCIEFFSPATKRGEGREECLDRRAAILEGEGSLLEIDLIRTGQRVPFMKPALAYPYFVSLNRARRRPFTEIWPIEVNDALPWLPVPLAGSDVDVTLDLQAALTNVYDTFNYEFLIDYAKPPSPPLIGEAEAWADRLLREKGKR